MKAFVALVRPLLLQLATSPAVKNLVLELLKKYVTSTDNSIDNVVYEIVETKLFRPQVWLLVSWLIGEWPSFWGCSFLFLNGYQKIRI